MSKEIYLVFCHMDDHPLVNFLKPGFSHVHALLRSDVAWVLLNPSFSSLDMVVLGHNDERFLHVYHRMNPEHIIMKLELGDCPDLFWGRACNMSCVSVIQYLLGVFWPLTLTPWQLYSKLVSKTPGHIRILSNGKFQESGEGS